jgi:hypothetical protein
MVLVKVNMLSLQGILEKISKVFIEFILLKNNGKKGSKSECFEKMEL